MTSSKDLAIENCPYESWNGSPISEGILQFDMWKFKSSDRWECDSLK